jgi:two-component system, chemotaxis family, chemotaxis protein CheY
MAKKIIVIDDSQTARRQVCNVLSDAGYEVVEAVDGQDGFDKILQHHDAKAIVCDMNMPRMSGLEVLRAARAEVGRAELPFLMLTTETQTELVQQARLGGAKGWIIKPFKPEILLAAVNRLAG